MQPAPFIKVYQTNPEGYFNGEHIAYLVMPPIPVEGSPPKYGVGYGAVLPEPPPIRNGFNRRYVSRSEYGAPGYDTDGNWTEEPVPVEPVEEDPAEVTPTEETQGN